MTQEMTLEEIKKIIAEVKGLWNRFHAGNYKDVSILYELTQVLSKDKISDMGFWALGSDLFEEVQWCQKLIEHIDERFGYCLFSYEASLITDVLVIEKYRNGWDRYRVLWEGDWIQMGDYPEVGCNNPKVEEQEKALSLLSRMYNEIKPHESNIMELYKSQRCCINSINYNKDIELLGNICKEYHNQEFNISEAKKHITKTAQEIMFPSFINENERAKKYFSRAIEAGYMQQTGYGFKWVFGGNRGQIRLGYLCFKAFAEQRPINDLEALFGVKKLSSSITQASYKAERSDAKAWKKEMEDKIFHD